MLKIKDNIDLKELEKYGFFINGLLDYTKRIGGVTVMCTTKNDKCRELYLFRETESAYIDGKDLDTLYDLIKADLVEKVGELDER